MKIGNHEVHPAAEPFRLIDGQELARLAEDIKANGLRLPITLCGGKILDGRNRYLACIEAGVEPRFEEVDSLDPFALSWSLNAERRHWNDQGERSATWLKHNAARAALLKAKARESKSEKAREAGRKGGRGKKGPATNGRTLSKEPVARKAAAKEAGVSAYWQVQTITGTEVFVVFVHLEEREIRASTLTDLQSRLLSHEYVGPKMGRSGMVFFRYDEMPLWGSLELLG